MTNSYFSFLKVMKPVLILSEASDVGMPSDDDVVPSWAVICSTFEAAVAFNSVFSLYYYIIMQVKESYILWMLYILPTR